MRREIEGGTEPDALSDLLIEVKKLTNAKEKKGEQEKSQMANRKTKLLASPDGYTL